MNLRELTQRAMEIRQRYAALELAKYGRAWTEEEIALGFVGDVGDLMKLIMAHNGIRAIPNAEEKLSHELADCLWAILVLAEMGNVDLEQAFLHTMDELARHILDQHQSLQKNDEEQP
ncbi:MAG: MazG nucleotide pyrophosphohydrolase domain-containing protein [Caldilineaceae bacterium]